MGKWIKQLLIWGGVLTLLLLILNFSWVPGVLFRIIFTPEKAYERFETGAYSSWSWTPDGRIIYITLIEQTEHTRGMGTMGYKDLGTVTQIRIINPDGTGDKLLKEVFYPSVRQKLLRRYHYFQDLNKGVLTMELSDQANRESAKGILDTLYPDAPLAHIRSFIDWNAKNNKLVFVANDGRGREGIAVSDPEFKEVKWINYEGTYPKWSPDGKTITFIKTRVTQKGGTTYIAYTGDIWLMDEEGKNQKPITEGYIFDQLCWFPDGGKILVHHERDDYRGTGIVDINTGKMEKIGQGLDPSISPDGKWVVYFDVDIKIKDINGKHKRVLYPYGGSSYPQWSSDGKKILMGCAGGVQLINPDGTGYFEVTKNRAN